MDFIHGIKAEKNSRLLLTRKNEPDEEKFEIGPFIPSSLSSRPP